MTQPTQNDPEKKLTKEERLRLLFHIPPRPVLWLIAVLTVIGGTLGGICPDLVSASVFAAVTAGFFCYQSILLLAPRLLWQPIICAGLSLILTQSIYHALQALLFFPMALAMAYCITHCKGKTQAVIRGALTYGINLAILFLVSFAITHGTVSADALKLSYNNFFDTMQAQMTDSMLEAYHTMETAAQTAETGADLSHPIIDGAEQATEALPTETVDREQQSAATEAYVRSLVDLSVNSVKLAAPAIVAVSAQTLAYAALAVYSLLAKLTRTANHMIPPNFRITVRRATAVIFVIAYLINILPNGDSISMMQIASANLATLLMPGIFIMGLSSLRRRAKDPRRRRSFIVTAVVLGFLLFVFPSYAVFFVLIDGIGEVFFGGRSIF